MISIPDTGSWRLSDATVPIGMVSASVAEKLSLKPTQDGCYRVTLDIDGNGLIEAVWPAETAPETQVATVRAGNAHVWTRMADLHTHIDKSQTWHRAPNQDGTFNGAKEAAKADRTAPWSHEDATARMEFALKCALAHGTRSIRTHLDSQKGRTQPTWDAFADLRERWADRIALQPCASLGAAKLMDEYGEEVAALTAQYNGVLGPVLYPGPEAAAQVRRAFDLAERHNLPIDFHTDENLDPESNGLSLIAEEAIRRNWQGSIVCGHCCSLSLKPADEAQFIAERVEKAGIGVVALPMTNIYLLGRDATSTPVYRGLAPIHLLRAAGVPVAFGSDNCRDAFHPYGDHDLVEVFRETARIGHADMSWGPWADAVAAVPDRLIGLQDGNSLKPGAAADLVIFRGRSFSEVFSRLGAPRTIVVKGRALSETQATPPAFSELDGLNGLAPAE